MSLYHVLPLYQPTGAGGSSNTPVNPGAGTIALTGYAPTISQPQAITAGAGTVILTGYAPSVAQSANQSITAGAGTLALTGFAPSVAQTANQGVAPGAGSMAITGYAPSVTQTSGATFIPGPGTLAITGYAPSVVQTANQAITPDAGNLVITGYAPTVFVSDPRTANPLPGALTITGYAPTVTQGVATDPRFARPNSDVAAGAWVPSSGADLYAMIDEPSADSSDYISTSSASSCTIQLNPVVDPSTSSGQVVRYQAWSATGNGLTVNLMQGATMIAQWVHASLPITPTIYAQALTGAQCDSITDYANLRFQFVAS